jgi:hypothetical protein
MTGLRFLIHERDLWNNVVEATESSGCLTMASSSAKSCPGEWGRELAGGCLGWAERKFCKDGRISACDGQHVSTFPPAIVTASLRSKCPEASTRDGSRTSLRFRVGVGAAVRDCSPSTCLLNVNICRSDDVTAGIRHSNWKTSLLFSHSTMPNLPVLLLVATNQCRPI